MNDLIVVEKLAEWQRLKTLVLDSVSSPITRRVYNMALDEFIEWYRLEPRAGFTKATVSAWRVSLEARTACSLVLIKDKLFEPALAALSALPERQPKLEAVCQEGLGDFRIAAECHLAAPRRFVCSNAGVSWREICWSR